MTASSHGSTPGAPAFEPAVGELDAGDAQPPGELVRVGRRVDLGEEAGCYRVGARGGFFGHPAFGADADQGDEAGAAEVEAPRRDHRVLPIDQRPLGAVVEEVAGAGVAVGDGHRGGGVGPGKGREARAEVTANGRAEVGDAALVEVAKGVVVEGGEAAPLPGSRGQPGERASEPVPAVQGRRALAGDAVDDQADGAGMVAGAVQGPRGEKSRRRPVLRGQPLQRPPFGLQRPLDQLDLRRHLAPRRLLDPEEDPMPHPLQRFDEAGDGGAVGKPKGHPHDYRRWVDAGSSIPQGRRRPGLGRVG